MDESIVKHLEVGTITLSAAMRLGIPKVEENRTFCGCALGTAYYYKTGRYLRSGSIHCAREFDIPIEVAQHISERHFMGAWSREQCADYAESLGY